MASQANKAVVCSTCWLSHKPKYQNHRYGPTTAHQPHPQWLWTSIHWWHHPIFACHYEVSNKSNAQSRILCQVSSIYCTSISHNQTRQWRFTSKARGYMLDQWERKEKRNLRCNSPMWQHSSFNHSSMVCACGSNVPKTSCTPTKQAGSHICLARSSIPICAKLTAIMLPVSKSGMFSNKNDKAYQALWKMLITRGNAKLMKHILDNMLPLNSR